MEPSLPASASPDAAARAAAAPLRPWPVTVVCVLGGVAALVTAVLFAVDALWAVPPGAGLRVLVYAALAVTLTGLRGMWTMRRWGVLLIGLLFAARLAASAAGQLAWNPAGLAGPTLLVVVGLAYLRRMR